MFADWKLKRLGSLLLVMLMITGCMRFDMGAPVRNSTRTTASSQVKSGPYVVVVRKGDTLYSIAKHHNVDLRTLMDENRMRPPYALNAGQSIRIPAPRTHLVRKGETMYSISRTYGIETSTLASMNKIPAPYTIVPGQQLSLPGSKGNWLDRKVASVRNSAIGGRSSPKKSSPPKVNAKVKQQGRFLWPVNGRVISGYGGKGNGSHNDGVNIAVPSGAPIFAADNGVVTYTGNELKGYGNLILIRHTGNWVSAYSHNRRVRVERGQQVKRGQHIADAGQTGGVDRPQLHFELRRGSRAVDPLGYLSTR